MSTNSSFFFDSYPIKCDESYNAYLEFLKFFLQAIYLIPGCLIILKILYIILFSHRAKYTKNNYFFRFYVIDLVASFYNSFSDLIFGRFFIYITPLCAIFAPFFYDFSIYLQVSNNLYNYFRALKSVTQILLTTNRMTCVIFPMLHQHIWKSSFKHVVAITLFSPFLAIWNLMISRNYITETFGGFHVNHKNAISWASLSKFQLAFISVALVCTFLNTALTLYGLHNLSHRVKSTEKTLCLTSFIISIGFFAAGVFQFVFAYCKTCSFPVLFGVQFLTFDLINIGSPLMMIIMNPELRAEVISGFFNNSPQTTRISVQSINSS